MSSTNVHSENKKDNILCVGAQIIPTGKRVIIPLESAQKITFGDGMEIRVESSTLNEKGQLIGKNGDIVGIFSQKQVRDIKKGREARKTEKNRRGTSTKSER